MAAVISNQGGFYSTFAYVSEARRLGVRILRPDVQKSQIRWQGGQGTMHVGLMAIKGLSADTIQGILAQRHRRPFGSPMDFFRRVGPDESEARSLILCGALDTLAPDQSRAQMLWHLSRWHNQRAGTRRLTTLPLFAEETTAVDPPALPADDPMERLRREFRVLGFLCECHPMTLYSAAVRRSRSIKARDLVRYLDRNIRFAGWLITGKVVRTKSGDPMEFLTFEDETGVVETTFFPRTYDRFCHIMDYGRPYLLEGKVEQNWGAVTLTVSRVRPLAPTS